MEAQQAKKDITQHNAHLKTLEASINSTEMRPEEIWHLNRRKSINGSDAGAVLGVNQDITPLHLYNDKQGLSPEQQGPHADTNINPDTHHFSHDLEHTIAQEYMRRTGKTVHRKNQTLPHSSCPWMVANLSYLIVDDNTHLECHILNKHLTNAQVWGAGNAYALINNEWRCTETCDKVPEAYQLRCLHNMIVTGQRQTDLAVLIEDYQLRIYTLHYNQDLADILIDAERDFWINNVCRNTPPPPLNNNDLNTLYLSKIAPEKVVVATPEIIDAYCELKWLQAQIKALEIKAYGVTVENKKVGGLDIKIKKFMAHAADILVDEDGKRLCSFKEQRHFVIDAIALKQAHKAIAEKFTKEASLRVFIT